MISVHRVPIVALLALIPVAAYTFMLYPIAGISLVNVVLIAVSVYLMFLPSESTVKATSA